MKIIVVGCGKVGLTLIEHLRAEDHEITVIDVNPEILKSAATKHDVQGVAGNGVSYNVQLEAGIENADVFIAVTHSDELNLLCCLIAKNSVKVHTIARIRNPIYSKEGGFIKDKIGLSMIINPELTAAEEIARLLRFPSAIQIETFAKGRIEMMNFKVLAESVLDGMNVRDVVFKLRCDVLICAIERGEQVIIPTGEVKILAGDRVSFISTKKAANDFFHHVRLDKKRIRNVMIVGGGEIGYYLSGLLNKSGLSVTLVEKNKKRCEELCELLPGVMVIEGDGSDKHLLIEEGLRTCEAFVALTNFDETNVLLSLYAKTQTNAKLITKINSVSFDEIINNLELDSIVLPKSITADYIMQYVRAMQNTIGSNVETLYHICSGKVEALEFFISNDSPVAGIPLEKLNIKPGILICCINHANHIVIPRGQDCIRPGDTVVVVTALSGLRDISDILDD